MRPDIIFIFSDQQRADTVSPKITPELCKMAEEGAKFSSAYTCQPVCGPARACLQTGVYATQNGCVTNGIPMDDRGAHLADLFAAAGYETAYIGKWHLASRGLEYRDKGVPKKLRGGYEYWLAADLLEFSSNGEGGVLWDGEGNEVRFDGVRADKMTDLALEYLKKPKERPVFLFLSFLEPHHQNTSGRFECPQGYAERFRDFPVPGDLLGLKGNYRENYADYLGCCKVLDENVGKIVRFLKESGRYEKTLIVYCSDHGCHFMTRNDEYKRSCHQGSVHIPLIFGGGAFEDMGDTSRLVSLIDLPPTLLKAAGIDVPESFSGIALQDKSERDCVFVQISESHNGRCVITDRYTYSVSSGTNYCPRAYRDDYLYDRKTDEFERRNLINSPAAAEIKEKLRALLAREMIKSGEKAPVFKRRLIKGNI